MNIVSTINQIKKKEEMRLQVKQWLDDLKLDEYYNMFIGNGFDRMDAIYELKQSDLIQLNVKLGHCKIILKCIAKNNHQ